MWPIAAKLAALLFVAGSVANVAGVVWTKPLLMPLLLAWALVLMPTTSTSGKWRLYLVAALIFSWFGDLALMNSGEDWFLLGIGAFGVAQISYVLMFRIIPGFGLVKAWKLAMIPYLGYWLLMNVVLTPGDLRIPVLIYSALLVGMALGALDVALKLKTPWRLVPAIGAALFVFSDSLIALNEFNTFDVFPALIMFTYLVGQALIIGGVILGQTPTASDSRSF